MLDTCSEGTRLVLAASLVLAARTLRTLAEASKRIRERSYEDRVTEARNEADAAERARDRDRGQSDARR
jgi:hypothetical protein